MKELAQLRKTDVRVRRCKVPYDKIVSIRLCLFGVFIASAGFGCFEVVEMMFEDAVFVLVVMNMYDRTARYDASISFLLSSGARQNGPSHRVCPTYSACVLSWSASGTYYLTDLADLADLWSNESEYKRIWLELSVTGSLGCRTQRQVTVAAPSACTGGGEKRGAFDWSVACVILCKLRTSAFPSVFDMPPYSDPRCSLPRPVASPLLPSPLVRFAIANL